MEVSRQEISRRVLALPLPNEIVLVSFQNAIVTELVILLVSKKRIAARVPRNAGSKTMAVESACAIGKLSILSWMTLLLVRESYVFIFPFFGTVLCLVQFFVWYSSLFGARLGFGSGCGGVAAR
jgi:hypothetical protein